MGIGANRRRLIAHLPSNSLHLVGVFVANVAVLQDPVQHFTNPALGIDWNSSIPACRSVLAEI
jgi:hypothetical protein